METLKEKTAKGLFWGSLNSGVQQFLGLLFGIILGRLLSQSDYGMMAMIAVFSSVATSLQESGFRTALTNLPNPKDEDYNSVFWFNIVMATAMYLILFFAAPLIGNYYHTADVVPLCRYAFLTIILSALGTAQSAYLFRRLRAKQQAKASIAAVIASNIVGATMAWQGFGYWSLATQNIIYVALNSFMQWHYSTWRPTVKNISFEPIKRMYRFSVKILASTIAGTINNNVLNILLGRYFSPHDTGTYNQAYQWNSKCTFLVQGMVSQVTLPLLANLQNDGERQLRALRKLVRFTAFISFPLLLGFGLVAKEFIVLTITEKWMPSAELIQFLSISGAVAPLSTVLSNVIVSKGRSGTYFWCTLSLGVALIALMVGIWPLGIRSMVYGYVCLNTAWLFVWLYFAYRLTGYGLLPFLSDTLPFALTATATMVATHFATLPITQLWLLLIARILLAAAIYYLVMRIARVKILDECIAFISKKKSA